MQYRLCNIHKLCILEYACITLQSTDSHGISKTGCGLRMSTGSFPIGSRPESPGHVRGRTNSSLTFEFRKCLSYNQILNRSNWNISVSNSSKTSLWNLFWNILNMIHVWYIWKFGTNVQFRAYHNLQGLVHLTICMKFFEFSGSK